MDPTFFQTIEEHFVRLRGAPLILSPSDWHVAAGWWDRRIPLPVILRAIDDVFERAAARGKEPARSLAYCRHAVEREFARHVELSLGMPEEGGAPGPGQAAGLQRVRRRVGRLDALTQGATGDARTALEAARAAVEAALSALAEGRATPASTEEILAEQERRVTDALVDGLSAEDRAELDGICRQRVAPYREGMATEVLESTLRRCRQAEMRRRFRLPRLSLLVD